MIYKMASMLFIGFMVCSSLLAQVNDRVWNYIQNYRDIAINEMQRTGIPASITLAQGLLESGIGESLLAKEGNNHFGIKCHDWTGPSLRYTDDAPNECFRKYNSAYESYIDHSNFLTGRKRYSILFTYNKEDYISWAKGLKSCGYATNPKYAELLIEKIEKYYLNIYDKANWQDLLAIVETNRQLSLGMDKPRIQSNGNETTIVKETYVDHQKQNEPIDPLIEKIINSSNKNSLPNTKIGSNKPKTANDYNSKASGKLNTNEQASGKVDAFKQSAKNITVNGCNAIVYNYDVAVGKVANSLNLTVKKLARYNDLSESLVLKANVPVYTKAKKLRYKGKHRKHKVKVNETVADIAQHYGVRKNTLLKLNLLYPTQNPKAGEIIYLKKKRKIPPLIR